MSEPATDQRIVESENGSNMSSINISDIIAVSHVETSGNIQVYGAKCVWPMKAFDTSLIYYCSNESLPWVGVGIEPSG